MDCKFCGTPLAEGMEFCPACGSKQTEDAAPMDATVRVSSAPVTEIPAEPSIEPFVEPPVDGFDTPDFSEPAPKKKGKAKKIIIPIVAVVTAAAVLLCVFNWKWITLFFTDLFGKPETLRDKVTVEQTDKLADTLSSRYGATVENIKDVISGQKHSNTTVELVVGDKIEKLVVDNEDLIVDNLGSEFEGIGQLFKLVDGSYVKFEGGSADNVLKMAITAGLSGEELVGAGLIADLVGEKLYVSAPTLSDTHLDLSHTFSYILHNALIPTDELSATDSVDAALELLDALPSEATVNSLLKKYIGVALKEFNNVSKEKTSVTIGGIKEKVTVLDTEISYSNAMNAWAAILETMSDDADIKAAFIKICKAMNSVGADVGDPDELYGYFRDELELEAGWFRDDAEEGADYGGEIVVTQYLNSSYEIIGMALEADDEEIVSYISVSDGDNFATEVEVYGEEVFTGKGTNKKGIVNGTFELGADGVSIGIRVTDFDKNAFKKGNLKGSFEIIPDEEVMDTILSELEYYLPSPAVSALSLFDFTLKLDINTTATGGSLQVSITDDGDPLVGVKLSTALTDEKVTVPDPSVTTMDPEEWLESFSFDQVGDTLNDLGVPSDLIGELSQFFYAFLYHIY